jgi:predicted RNA-binding Zn-ribbon protein involved in translation (DUF1610 family)
MTETIAKKVIYACAKCGEAYVALQSRAFVKQARSFRCSLCDDIVLRWIGDYDFSDWERARSRQHTNAQT